MGLINVINSWYKTLKFNRLDVDEILAVQQRRLRRLLRHAVGNSEFYKALYKGIDIETCNLADLPVVTKAAMKDNYDRLVTDKRLKLHQLQNWVQDEENDSKYYLGDYSPTLSSGSTGQSAVITYHRKALDNVQASLLANYPFLPKGSLNDHIYNYIGHLIKRRPRIAVIAVPRGNIAPLFQRISPLHRLFINVKFFRLSDPLHKIIEELNNC